MARHDATYLWAHYSVLHCPPKKLTGSENTTDIKQLSFFIILGKMHKGRQC